MSLPKDSAWARTCGRSWRGLEPARSIGYVAAMSTVEEIERAAERLTPEDFDRLAAWVSARYHNRWKDQMDRDAAVGKLDYLFREADAEREAGTLHDWPAKEE